MCTWSAGDGEAKQQPSLLVHCLAETSPSRRTFQIALVSALQRYQYQTTSWTLSKVHQKRSGEMHQKKRSDEIHQKQKSSGENACSETGQCQARSGVCEAHSRI